MAAACGSTGDEDNKLCSAPQEGVFKKGHLRRHALGLASATQLKRPHNPSHITGMGGSSHLLRGLHPFPEAEAGFPSIRWALKWPLEELALQWTTSSSPLQSSSLSPQQVIPLAPQGLPL